MGRRGKGEGQGSGEEVGRSIDLAPPAPRRPFGCSTSPTSRRASSVCGAETQPPWCAWCPMPPSSSAHTRSTSASWAAITASVESEAPIPHPQTLSTPSCPLLSCLSSTHSPHQNSGPGRAGPYHSLIGSQSDVYQDPPSSATKKPAHLSLVLLPHAHTCGPWAEPPSSGPWVSHSLSLPLPHFQSPAPLAPPPRRGPCWNHSRFTYLPAGPGTSAHGCDPKGNVSSTMVTLTSTRNSLSSEAPSRFSPSDFWGLSLGLYIQATGEAVLSTLHHVDTVWYNKGRPDM